MKIVFVIKALGNPGGGAERVLAQVVTGLCARGHEICVVSSDPPAASPYYALSDSVTFYPLGLGAVGGQSNALDLIRRALGYRRVIRSLHPHIVVAFMHSTYIPVSFSMLGTAIPLVASEHSSPERYRTRPVERLLLYMAPLLCTQITVVSEQTRQSFGWWLRRRMVVIPNPVTVSSPSRTRIQPSPLKKVLLAVGRLASPKDHKVLVSAFSSISADFSDWTLRIVGEGDLRGALEAQIKSLGLKDRVELPGARANIEAEFMAADLYVVPSTYESFGLATAEALLYGLPAIGFADCLGTNDLIKNGENGRLVYGSNRVMALAGVLSELMDNPAERQRLSDSSRRWIHDRYGIDGVLDQWESVLSAACE